MIKGIYISEYDLKKQESGVAKKILSQVRAMNRMGLYVEAPNFSVDTKLEKIVRRLPFFNNKYNKNVEKFVKNNEINFVYVRHSMCNIYTLRILNYLKKRRVLIIYEFPTFPYDKNSYKISWFLLLAKDMFSRNFLKNYVNKVVNYSEYDCIYGIPCIKISNGIDISNNRMKKILDSRNEINFIGVALIADWHGFDRLILSIAEYFNMKKESDPDVFFHIVGNGDGLNKLKKMVKQYHVERNIKFHGVLYGEDLDELYDKCNIGVGALATFRKYKNHVLSTLKTKEYCAKGIPFLKNDKDLVFDSKKVDFVYTVSDNENKIDLVDVLEWYKHLLEKESETELTKRIHKFAEEYLTWEEQLKPVVNYIKEETDEYIPKNTCKSFS